jgi:hypothetical protein
MSGQGEQRRKAQIRKLVANAPAIVTYQVGLTIGCVRMRNQPHPFREKYPAFDEYLGNLKGLPIGSERLYWAQDALRDRDKKIEKINARFRDRIFDTCFEIIRTFREESRRAGFVTADTNSSAFLPCSQK